MNRTILRSLAQMFRTGATPQVAVVGGADLGPIRQVHPEPLRPRRELAPIVHLPVGENRNAAESRSVAKVDLQVKQFRGRHVEDERYTARLHATSDAPAALLAALADAAREIDELACESAPDEHLIMRITIRR